MAKRHTPQETPENLAEDELPQQSPETLEQFLADTFGEEAPPTSEGGLPSLGFLKSKFKTKSAAIRYLHTTCNATPAQISKLLGVKYQHVRNVITTPLKRGPNEQFQIQTDAPEDKSAED